MVDRSAEQQSNQPANEQWARVAAASLPSAGSATGSRQDNPREDVPPNGAVSKEDRINEQTAQDMQANRSLRETYADKAYQLATGCISIWAVLLGLQGVVKVAVGVEMWSDKVIIAVTTGVTVSVLAAFLGVIRGLFGNGGNPK